MHESTDIVVVGGGAVGLAIARDLAQRGLEVVVLEQHESIGQETSSRNSGVIHSGIYYPHDSLKAQLCVRGREMLYRYCAERHITHSRVGKIIVAQREQTDALRTLYERGERNGVADLRVLSADEVIECEPLIRCAAGIWVPSAGIFDVHEFMLSLWADLERAGGIVSFRSRASAAHIEDESFSIEVHCEGSVFELRSRWLINAAGLHAPNFLLCIEGYPPSLRKQGYYAKGSYFQLKGRGSFNHLIYPMPDEAGLGIHATIDLDGSVRFGPDVEWVTETNYDVSAARKEHFYEAIRRYWPSIPEDSLSPAYAGIRPKLVGPHQKSADFIIEYPSEHGVSGLINLLGIESPGLTASLAIAASIGDYVAARA